MPPIVTLIPAGVGGSVRNEPVVPGVARRTRPAAVAGAMPVSDAMPSVAERLLGRAALVVVER